MNKEYEIRKVIMFAMDLQEDIARLDNDLAVKTMDIELAEDTDVGKALYNLQKSAEFITRRLQEVYIIMLEEDISKLERKIKGLKEG